MIINEALASLITLLPGVEALETITLKGESQHLLGIPNSEIVLRFLLPSEFTEAIEWIQQNTGYRVMLISADWTEDEIKDVLRRQAYGCIDSSADLQELGEAIRQVERGGIYLSPELSRILVLAGAAEFSEKSEPTFESLTPREQELIPLLCQGLNNKQIAQRLYLSVRTVENHLSNIYKKLNLNSRTEVAVFSIQMGWVTMPD